MAKRAGGMGNLGEVGRQRVWFTADTHFGHAAMLRPDYCDRPFFSVEEMDHMLLRAWVAHVKPGDRVYHLGDVALRDFDAIADKLPGQLYLIIGNHDSKRTIRHPRWIWAREAAYIMVASQKIHLSHYPFETWRNAHHGAWHLHGHSHGNLLPRGRRMDVGVDTRPDFAPWSFEQIAAIMAGRQYVQVDHHIENVTANRR